jgi:signal transduction histidine kinase
VAEESLRISEANGRAAVLEERNRMARDMHDTLAQGFTGVIVQLEAAKQAFAHGSSADMDGHIHRASELARQSLGEARRSIRALRPRALEHTDLCVALDDAMKQMTAGTGLQAEFTTHGKPRALMASSEENLLRIHVEILTNALKHSGAKVIKGALSFGEDAVRLEVQDDGGGFDLAKQHDGLGLLGIRERVNRMNGKLTVESRVGAGTRICIALPNEARSAGGGPH